MIQSSIAFFTRINEFLKNIVEEILKNLQIFSTYLLTHFPSHTCSSSTEKPNWGTNILDSQVKIRFSQQYLATLTKITQIGGALKEWQRALHCIRVMFFLSPFFWLARNWVIFLGCKLERCSPPGQFHCVEKGLWRDVLLRLYKEKAFLFSVSQWEVWNSPCYFYKQVILCNFHKNSVTFWETLFQSFLHTSYTFCINLNLIGPVFHLEFIKNQLLQAQHPTT